MRGRRLLLVELGFGFPGRGPWWREDSFPCYREDTQ